MIYGDEAKHAILEILHTNPATVQEIADALEIPTVRVVYLVDEMQDLVAWEHPAPRPMIGRPPDETVTLREAP